jgi:hypothetical protein
VNSGTVANSVCIALLAFAFYCDSVTRNSKRLFQTPESRATSSDVNVHAVVRLRHKSPHGKGIECAESVLVQKSQAMFNQRRQSIIDLARDVMVAEDRLRIQTLSSLSCDHRLRSAIHPCSSADNTAIQFSRVQRSAIKRSQHDRSAMQRMRFDAPESMPC